MISRAVPVVALVLAVAGAGARPAAGDPPRSVSSYFLARADARLCPSPACGGIWVRLVNRRLAPCGQPECYAAEADLTRLEVGDERRAVLQRLLTEGRGLARGTLVRGLVQGFPELDTLVVAEAWPAATRARPAETFHRLRDNGVRCVTTPCFSIHAARLNGRGHTNVSSVNLSRTGTSPGTRRRALEAIAGSGLIVAGRLVRVPGAGPAGDGKEVVANQLYIRAPG